MFFRTIIQKMNVYAQDNNIYDLSGRRSYGTGRGIYIKGGKKYVVY